MTKSHLADRAIIRVSATDDAESAQDFLQGLVTHDVQLLRGPEPLWAALLSAQGKCLFDFILWADGGDVLLDCEAEVAPALARKLTLYRLRRKIDISQDDALSVHWQKPATDTPMDGRLPSSEGLEGLRRPLDPRHVDRGHRWISDETGDDASDAFRAHRLSLGIAEGQAEFGEDKTLWLECNAAELNGVSFKKGCYVGQENTARMNWRKKVNRRIVVVPIDRADEKRQRVAYPDLGYSVEHRRIDDMADLPLPEWQRLAIAAAAVEG